MVKVSYFNLLFFYTYKKLQDISKRNFKMAVPDYQSFMYPLLELFKDGNEHILQEAYIYLAGYFNLTTEDKEEVLPSGSNLFIIIELAGQELI